MYQFRVTTPHDDADVKRALLEPRNRFYNFGVNDFQGEPEDWTPTEHPSIVATRCSCGRRLLGFIFLFRKTEAIAEAHMAFLPTAYGEVRDITRRFLNWVHGEIIWLREIVAPCCTDNAKALACLLGIGFKPTYVESGAWADPEGNLHDFQWLSYKWGSTCPE